MPASPAEVAERAMLAPLCVEPGTEGDAPGVEGRHRNNIQKIFAYLAHLEKVVNNHACLAADMSHQSSAVE